jgi:hypothetical protein
VPSSLSLVLSLATIFSSSCVASALGGKRPIDDGAVQGTLHLPRLYQPLMPGSMYPNKRVPVAVENQPAVVVVPAAEGSGSVDRAVTQLTTRGLVAFVLKTGGGAGRPDLGHVDGAVRLLSRVHETRGAPVGVLLFHPEPDFAASVLDVNHVSAVVILGLPAVGTSPTGTPDLPPSAAAKAPVLVSNLSDDMEPSVEISRTFRWMLGRKPVEKWYRPEPKKPDAFPPEAFRDAAEWLAIELELR